MRTSTSTSIVSTRSKLRIGVDEMTIAGGLAGGPINMVRGRTVDLIVPAVGSSFFSLNEASRAPRSGGPAGRGRFKRPLRA
jgi:hypothetical protein